MRRLSRARAVTALLLLPLFAAACGRTAAIALPPPVAPQAAAVTVDDVDPTTLHRKLLFGYQGWFGCPG